MTRKYPSLAFTPSVQQAQSDHGSKAIGDRLRSMSMDDEHLSFAEIAMIEERDSFYVATVNDDGWPYVQYRGGPPGFLKVLDDQTLGFADYRGNRQYITTGNLRANDRVSLFLMDYPNRRRLKIMARAQVIEAEDRPDLVAQLHKPEKRVQVERIMLFHLEAFDWNCPQHITPRWTEAEWSHRNTSGRN